MLGPELRLSSTARVAHRKSCVVDHACALFGEPGVYVSTFLKASFVLEKD